MKSKLAIAFVISCVPFGMSGCMYDTSEEEAVWDLEVNGEDVGTAMSELTSVPSTAFFSQNSSSWTCNQLGTCSATTMGICSGNSAAGCAVTSVAMLLKKKGASVTPGTLNTWLKNNGGYQSGCLIYWATAANFDGTGGLLWVGTGSLTTTSALKGDLDAGRLIISRSDRFGVDSHFVVISGYNNAGTVWSDFTYWDPWDTTATIRKVGDGWVKSGKVTRIFK